jgi:ATP-dependent Lon protease
MPISKDSKNNKSSKKSYNTRTMKQDRKLKKNEESDSSDNDDESIHSESDEEETMDSLEYRKMLQKIFPSKNLKNKIISGEKLKKQLFDDNDEKEEDEEENINIKKRKTNHKKKTSKKEVVEESEEDEYETVDEDDSGDEEDSDEEDEEIQVSRSGKKGFNIVFTIGDPMRNEDGSEYDEDEDSDYEEEDEEEEEEEEEGEEEGEEEKNLDSIQLEEDISKQQETLNEIRKTFEGILEKDKNNKIALSGLKDLEEKDKNLKKQLNKKVKTQKNKNIKVFKDLINKKSLLNDYAYFKDNMTIEEQKKVITEVEEINKITIVQKPYRLSLLESDIPVHLKSIALSKISALRHMDPGNGEYYKVKNWVDTFMQLPFNRYKSLPLSIENGIDACHDYMANSKAILDQAVYGLNDAKLQIMQMVGQWISNPTSIGTAIAIKGPMGTGKTTLVKEGISKILNRDFAFIALGGATDSSFLEGHSYTYEGSTWGKIVDILVKTKSMNPVIYFDELDKISDTPKGEEIAGILTHLTDTAQNSQFHDKYFSEIDFDLSKCLFIFSYNDESKVNPILLDRMYKIQTAGYEKKDKRTISQDYLIPTIIQQVNFKEDDIIIPDETIDYLVENYTEGEKGVRNLKRSLEIIYTKLNLYRLMKPDSALFEKEMTLKVEFPYTVTTDIVKKLIKMDEKSTSLYGLYV